MAIGSGTGFPALQVRCPKLVCRHGKRQCTAFLRRLSLLRLARSKAYFKVKGQKTCAQVMATALAAYATSSALAGGNVAAAYGFNVSDSGTGDRSCNVGLNGSVIGLSAITVASGERPALGRAVFGNAGERIVGGPFVAGALPARQTLFMSMSAPAKLQMSRAPGTGAIG